MNGKVFDIQRFSVYDGPGIRTNVFLKGCPLKCLWCHNPESQRMQNELLFYAEKCVSCGKCVEICSNTHTENCIGCGRCAEVCEHGARKIDGYEISADEVVSLVLKDKEYYITSGGGVTISGGEPLMQADFTVEILKKCRENGINTCIETSGFAKKEVFEKVLPYLDEILYDIKGIDPELHRKNTGVTNEQILENAKLLMDRNFSVTFRMPYIPGFNDGELDEIRKFTNGFPLELMGYHKIGEGKYRALGREYLCADVIPPEKSDMAETAKLHGAIYNP